mmetsp:Transcript_83730/g.153724  ORF Transcript_83730/g.153724 Transcript_83730/m.153724 type:complete len:94 (+) Transcript_83730:32-313(+)
MGKPIKKELLPIGEGAYQSAEAVAQRTKDTMKDCEGDKNGCYLKHRGDLLDGHAYGHLKGKYGNPGSPTRSGSIATFKASFVTSLALISFLIY